jgi:hypothetical protein
MLNKTSQELQALYKNSPLSVEQKIRAQELEIELAEQILNFYDVMSAKLLSIKKTDLMELLLKITGLLLYIPLSIILKWVYLIKK